jgi:hypothetical protein
MKFKATDKVAFLVLGEREECLLVYCRLGLMNNDSMPTSINSPLIRPTFSAKQRLLICLLFLGNQVSMVLPVLLSISMANTFYFISR